MSEYVRMYAGMQVRTFICAHACLKHISIYTTIHDKSFRKHRSFGAEEHHRDRDTHSSTYAVHAGVASLRTPADRPRTPQGIDTRVQMSARTQTLRL
jgi:hypothetical protein